MSPFGALAGYRMQFNIVQNEIANSLHFGNSYFPGSLFIPPLAFNPPVVVQSEEAMASLVNRTGIEVEIPPATGCGNPCHPGHTCSSCEPFWHMMLSTGRFQAYVPPTFAGGTPANKPNFGGRKMDFADLKFRSRGSDS